MSGTFYPTPADAALAAAGVAQATADTALANQTFAALHLTGPSDSPMTAASAVINGGTIALPVGGDFRAVSSASAVTGVILAVGTIAGESVTLANVNATGGDAITFDALPATSHVATASYALVAARATLFRWNATVSLWFPVGV